MPYAGMIMHEVQIFESAGCAMELLDYGKTMTHCLPSCLANDDGYAVLIDGVCNVIPLPVNW